MRRNRLLKLLGASVISILAVGATPAGVAIAGDDPARRGQPHELYVAPWGNDSWSGSKSRPYATVGRAQREVRARTPTMRSDIVVNLRDGTYALPAPLRLSTQSGDSGRNGHRVIYQAAGFGTHRQARPIVSGGSEVDGWRLDDRQRNIWKAEVGRLDLRQLFVNGVRASRAALGGGLTGQLTTTASGFVVESEEPRSWQRPDDIEFIRSPAGEFGFSEVRCGVASIAASGAATTINMDQPCWQRALALYGVPTDSSDAARGLDPIEIENSKSFLDTPGEFYLDRSRPRQHALYYIPRAREDLRRAHVVAPVLDSLVEGVGTDTNPLRDVTFRGLTFSHATWLDPNTPSGFPHEFASLYQIGQPSENPFDQGGIMAPTNSLVPASVSFDHTERIVLQENRFSRLGAGGLLLARGSSNRVQGNLFTDISSSAIVLNAPRIPSGQLDDVTPLEPDQVAEGNRVENNWIHRVGVEYHGGVGMLVLASKETIIAHNQINDVPHNGIAVIGDDPPELDPPNLVDSTSGLRILNNRVFDTLTTLDDGGGIYSAGEMGTSFDDGSEISGNVVTDDGASEKLQVGIYTDWLTNWKTVRQNVVYGHPIATGGCVFFYIRNIRFVENFWDQDEPTWFCGFGTVEDISVVDNTLLTGDPEQACGADPACGAIVNRAGLQPAYRHLLNAG